MTRSESRNSINNDNVHPKNSGGLSLASMGTGRHSAARNAERGTTPSRTRGSSVYIGGDDSGL